MKKIILLIFVIIAFPFLSVNAQSAGNGNIAGAYNAIRGSLSQRPNLWRGLVGCWSPSLGVSGIKTLRDISGYGNHGTMQGSMALDDWVISGNPRNPGYALDYDGVDDCVDITATPLSGYPFTLSQWVKVVATSGTISLTTLSNSAEVNQSLSVGISSGKARGGVYNSTSFFGVEGTTVFSVGDWVFVVFVAESATSREIYVNGVLEATETASVGFPTGLNKVGIGSLIRSSQVWYAGIVDDTRVYNRALSAAEIQDMHLFPKAMFQLSENLFIPGKAPIPPSPGGGRNQIIIISKYLNRLIGDFEYIYKDDSWMYN